MTMSLHVLFRSPSVTAAVGVGSNRDDRCFAKAKPSASPTRSQSQVITMSFCTFKGGEVYKDHWKTGVYVCSKCENELFSSQQKVAHSSPWPAFSQPIHEGSITKYLESPNAWKVKCGKCDQGLGHEFTGSHSGNPDGEPRF